MTASTPREAATVVVVRDGAGGPEVLLLQRAERGDHNSGAWVFPGGLVDPGDRQAGQRACALTDEQASSRLGLPSGGLAFYLAAIRECFEESGILFAADANGKFVSLDGAAGAGLAAQRHAVREGQCTVADLCERYGLCLLPEQLHYIGHWVTPKGRAKRFDTRFFLAIAPREQTALHDASETLDHVWIQPADALSPTHARRLMTPTRAMLETVRPFADTAALLRWAESPRAVPRVLPRLTQTAAGLQPVLPDHPAYHEVGKLDPDGQGHAWSELRPGVPVSLGKHVVRITNLSGTNFYRVGSDAASSEDLAPGSVRLIAEDRIVIAPDQSCVPLEWLASADWLAPERGFLQPLSPH